MSKQSDLISVSQGAAGDPLFIDTANNRVGVGTASPAQLLQLNGSSPFLNIRDGANSNPRGIEFDYNGSLISGSLINYGATGETALSGGESGTAGYFLTFKTDGSERARIDASGNVGIGLTNPGVPLHVKGFNNGNVMIVDATGTAANYIFDVRDDGTSVFRVDPSGNVGIGTSSPVYNLQVQAGSPIIAAQSSGANGTRLLLSAEDGAVYIGNTYSSSNVPIIFTQAGTSSGVERMRIDTAGRVTMPYQPAFQTNGAGYSLVANEIYAIRPSALFNTGGHYNVVNGRFTAPVTGKYKFHFLFTTATSGAAAPSLYFRRNGSGAHGRVLNYYAQYSSTSAHVVFDLNAGDFVEAVIEPWNSAAVVVWETSWGGYLIG